MSCDVDDFWKNKDRVYSYLRYIVKYIFLLVVLG